MSPSGIESSPREERLAAAFIELADTLIDDFDLMDYLHTLTEHAAHLLQVEAAGVTLIDPTGQMIDATASNEATRRLELAQIEWEEGPCWDCVRTGTPVPDTALGGPAAQQRWPRFSRWALARGFVAVAGVPLRLREQTVGALNLFHTRPGTLTRAQLRLGQALADVATIGLLQYRAVHDQMALAAQLQTALDHRIVIEQAKGVLAHRAELSVDEAFRRLRAHARRQRKLLTVVAGEVIDGHADPDLLNPHGEPTA